MDFKGKNNLSLATPIYADDIDESFCIIDIRDPLDYEICHIKGSYQLNNPFDVYMFIKQNSHKKCALVCYSGHNASIMGSELVDEGLENIYFYDDVFESLESAKVQLVKKVL